MAIADIVNEQQMVTLLSTTLAGKIGTYTYSNGLVTPAIDVKKSMNPPASSATAPQRPKVDGLEVIITARLGNIETEPLLNSRTKLALIYDIALKQWDENANIMGESLTDFDTSAPGLLLAAIQATPGLSLERGSTHLTRDEYLDTVEEWRITVSQLILL